MDGWTVPLSPSLALLPSITQPRHEYKCSLLKSRDRVPVNGFMLGLWQQALPLMGSAWLDSIMSPDTLWRGCKLSIRPPPTPISRRCLPLVPRDHLAIIHLAISQPLRTAFHILTPPLVFPVFDLPPKNIDMNIIQAGWNDEQRRSCTYNINQFTVTCAIKENITRLRHILECLCCTSVAFQMRGLSFWKIENW